MAQRLKPATLARAGNAGKSHSIPECRICITRAKQLFEESFWGWDGMRRNMEPCALDWLDTRNSVSDGIRKRVRCGEFANIEKGWRSRRPVVDER